MLHLRRVSFALGRRAGPRRRILRARRAADAATRSPRARREIGVTAKTVNIAVVADVDNPLAPNVFKPIVDGAQAGVKYVNANGGVAGRKLKIDFIDSHLNPNDTRNAIITACGQDLAMVGTATALFSGLDDITGCKDKAGRQPASPTSAPSCWARRRRARRCRSR